MRRRKEEGGGVADWMKGKERIKNDTQVAWKCTVWPPVTKVRPEKEQI